MTWVAAAVMGGSALLGASSARGAASMQADAAQRASDQQAAQYAQQRSDLQPWRASGEEANNRLRSLMGFDGSNPTASLQSTPGYQFRLGEGQKQVDNSAAARGSTLSGATLKALSRYGQDYASGEYQNQFNRLSGMSTVGQNAAVGQGAASMAFGNSQAQNTIGAGNANAAGTMGAANAFWQCRWSVHELQPEPEHAERLLQARQSRQIPASIRLHWYGHQFLHLVNDHAY